MVSARRRRARRETAANPNVDPSFEEPASVRISELPSSDTPISQTPPPVKDQYHHFIPRFILRNFALDDHLTHSRERHEIYQYSANDSHVQVSDVDTSYGVTNMYLDVQDLTNLNIVELELSNLEQQASTVINRILDLSLEEITLTFSELSSLRKFLWIMSFRQPSRRRQYTENRFCAKGKKIQLEVMKSLGRSSIDDIWLVHIKQLLLQDDCKFSVKFGTTGTLAPLGENSMENIDYNSHCMGTFLSIWDAPESGEFILTENGFNIFEGDCGRGFASSAYHYFYPISPRRIIVACSVSFKTDDAMGVVHRNIQNRLLGVDPGRSWFPRYVNVPPRPKYWGKAEGIGLYQDGTTLIFCDN